MQSVDHKSHVYSCYIRYISNVDYRIPTQCPAGPVSPVCQKMPYFVSTHPAIN